MAIKRRKGLRLIGDPLDGCARAPARRGRRLGPAAPARHHAARHRYQAQSEDSAVTGSQCGLSNLRDALVVIK